MREQTALDRSLGLWHLVLYGLAFTAPLVVLLTFGILDHASDGTAAGSYLMASVAIFFTAISYGRMSALHTEAGSAYTYARHALSESVGFLVGWSVLLDYFLVPMLAALLTAVYLTAALPEVPQALFVVGFIGLITAVNLFGLRITTGVNSLLMLFQGLVLLAFFALAIRYVIVLYGAASIETVKPLFRVDVPLSLTAKGASLAALSFLGFDAITTLSEEARTPARDVPRALILVAVIIGFIYVTAAFLAQLVEPDPTIKSASSAGLRLARMVGGDMFSSVFIIGMVVSQIGAGITAEASVARILYAMGSDGVLPARIFAYVSKRARVPVFNIVFSGTVGLLAVALSEEQGASLINFGAFVAFTSVNLCVIATWLRSRGTDAPRSALTWLVLPAIGAAFTGWLLFSLESDAKVVGLVWISIGFVYLIWLTRAFTRPPPSLRD
jgi:amino acid transporter